MPQPRASISSPDPVALRQVYGAHTTLSDLLWGGVPCLSLPLSHMATRIGASLLHSIDGHSIEPKGPSALAGMVVGTHKEYEDTMAAMAA